MLGAALSTGSAPALIDERANRLLSERVSDAAHLESQKSTQSEPFVVADFSLGSKSKEEISANLVFTRNTEKGRELIEAITNIDGSDPNYEVSGELLKMLDDSEAFGQAVDLLTVFSPNKAAERRLIFFASHSSKIVHEASLDLIRHAFESNDVLLQAAAIELLGYAKGFEEAGPLFNYKFDNPALRRQLSRIA